MTLNAKVRDIWERNEVSISGTMRSMTAQTLHSDVFVSCVHNLLAHRMRCMLRPIVAVLAKFDNRRLFQKEDAIRCVRGMTGLAISLLNRIMGEGTLYHLPFCGGFFLLLSFSQLCLQFHGIRMALSAEAFRIPEEQFFLFGGMRFMAIQTTYFINERPMDSILIKCVIHHSAMAPTAQFKSRLLGLQCIGRIGCFMALGADLIGHGCMHIIKQDAYLIRPVGIMAGGTVCLRHRIIHVLF